MWRHIDSNIFSLLILVMIMVSGMIVWGKSQFSNAGPLETAICLRVEPGARMSRVADDLAAKGAISSAEIFNIAADYQERTQDLKAGSFRILPASTMSDILDQITTAGQSTCGTEIVYRIGVTRVSIQMRELDPATNRFQELASFNPAADEIPTDYERLKSESDTRFRVLIAEGATSWQIVDSLRNWDILAGEVEDIPAEGSLAPDSYDAKVGMERSAILGQMARRQTNRTDQIWAARADDAPVGSKEDMLILASIIEKETGVAEERGLVASVFANRLRLGMKLQTDPTVIYGITKGEGTLGRGLRRSELRGATPWNTYVIDGLPPTPIANPGRAAMQAAVNPETSDFIFFVADGTGGHAFAKTLDEHRANVAKWRQIENSN